MTSFTPSNTSFSSLCDSTISYLFSKNTTTLILPENTPENRVRVRSIIEPIFDIHQESSRTQYNLQVSRLFAGFTIQGPFVESIDLTTSITVIIGIESILTTRFKELIDMILADSFSDFYFQSSRDDFTVRSCVDIDVFCKFLTCVVEYYPEYYEELSTHISDYLDRCEYHACITKCGNRKRLECDCVQCECILCINGFDRKVFNICNINPNKIFTGMFNDLGDEGIYGGANIIYRTCTAKCII
jgi:hypothetical protein